jgi:hypothetical protein
LKKLCLKQEQLETAPSFYATTKYQKKFLLDEDRNVVKEPGGQIYDAHAL